MNYFILLLIFLAWPVLAAPPEAPVVTYTVDGEQASAQWEPSGNVDGYKLYWTPYPIDTSRNAINSADLGLSTHLSTTLTNGTMLYVAVTAYNQAGESGFSNIEVIAINNALSGGDTTLFDQSSTAFANPAPNLDDEGLARHLVGDNEFEQAFVTAPAVVNSGLGPVFNNTSCVGCHPKDGRGSPPDEGGVSNTFFLRLSVPGTDPNTGGPLPVPGFGTQLFDSAIFGVQPEAKVDTTYITIDGQYGDGEPYQLRQPVFTIVDPYIELPDEYLTSPRVAPPVFGRGLLEAIPEQTLLEWADENDEDGDGISGRVNYVWDLVNETTAIGRFGHKASVPSVLIQNAGAYRDDMGITNEVLPQESTAGQSQYDGLGDDPELKPGVLDDVVFYIQTLAVPGRRNIHDPDVKRGQILFDQTGCAACHKPTVVTGELEGVPAVSNQVIHPYTDLLLHDMGPGLADGRPDFLANGQEWKTPPLWGIGYTRVVHNHTFFLHDGRARNLAEAILWHGGEAEKAKESFRTLPANDRAALIKFLESL